MYVITADGEPVAAAPAWEQALRAVSRALLKLRAGCAIKVSWVNGDETQQLNAGKVWEKCVDGVAYAHVSWHKNTIKDFTPRLSAEEKLIYDRLARSAERRADVRS